MAGIVRHLPEEIRGRRRDEGDDDEGRREDRGIELGHMAENNVLRGHPSGEERCDNCRYYLEDYKDISYCWHPKLRILVGGNWWCQWWEAIPDTP